MAKYVNLDDVVEHLEMHWGYEGLREDLYALPTADVAPVRPERWIETSISGIQHYRCSGCGEYIDGVWTANFDYRYCPNCGARMDGGADNGE